MPALKRARHTSHREIAGEAFVIDTRTQALHNLRGSGALIWKLLDGTLGAEQIAQAVTREFDVAADVAERDVRAFLDKLRAEDLVCLLYTSDAADE